MIMKFYKERVKGNPDITLIECMEKVANDNASILNKDKSVLKADVLADVIDWVKTKAINEYIFTKEDTLIIKPIIVKDEDDEPENIVKHPNFMGWL